MVRPFSFAGVTGPCGRPVGRGGETRGGIPLSAGLAVLGAFDHGVPDEFCSRGASSDGAAEVVRAIWVPVFVGGAVLPRPTGVVGAETVGAEVVGWDCPSFRRVLES